MANEGRALRDERPRELGRVGTAGLFIAAFGLLWIMLYFCILTWIASLLVDGFYHIWTYTMSFGWMMLLAGGILFVMGAGMMLGDWKRREPEPAVVPVKAKSTVGFDATHPQLEYHVEV